MRFRYRRRDHMLSQSLSLPGHSNKNCTSWHFAVLTVSSLLELLHLLTIHAIQQYRIIRSIRPVLPLRLLRSLRQLLRIFKVNIECCTERDGVKGQYYAVGVMSCDIAQSCKSPLTGRWSGLTRKSRDMHRSIPNARTRHQAFRRSNQHPLSQSARRMQY